MSAGISRRSVLALASDLFPHASKHRYFKWFQPGSPRLFSSLLSPVRRVSRCDDCTFSHSHTHTHSFWRFPRRRCYEVAADGWIYATGLMGICSCSLFESGIPLCMLLFVFRFHRQKPSPAEAQTTSSARTPNPTGTAAPELASGFSGGGKTIFLSCLDPVEVTLRPVEVGGVDGGDDSSAWADTAAEMPGAVLDWSAELLLSVDDQADGSVRRTLGTVVCSVGRTVG